ncbi:hypothetical protein CVV67_17720 [Arthrobacter stackebrandtii]|nr:hypothetical protein CVV67_17720 [Arthrobacter stackebrandtii]
MPLKGPFFRWSWSSALLPVSTAHQAAGTVGRQQAKRFHAAAMLATEGRYIVIRFLDAITKEISLTGEERVQSPNPHVAPILSLER